MNTNSTNSTDTTLRENKQRLISAHIRELMQAQIFPPGAVEAKASSTPATNSASHVAIAQAMTKMRETANINNSIEVEADSGLASQAKRTLRKLSRPMFAFQAAYNQANADLSAEMLNLIDYNERQQTNLYLRSVRHFEEKLEVLLRSIEWFESELESRDALINELKTRLEYLEKPRSQNADNRD